MRIGSTMSSTSLTDAPRALKGPAASGLRPWQFFLTASFIGAAAAVWLAPPASPVALLFMSLAVFAAGACAAALHALLTAISGHSAPETGVTGSVRETLEREKLLTLRSLKDLEFDKAMGKVSAADAAPMETRLRERAMVIMRDLDSRESTRLRVERDLAARSGARLQAPDSSVQTPGREPGAGSLEPVVCASCATANERDAKFCKGCGSKL